MSGVIISEKKIPKKFYIPKTFVAFKKQLHFPSLLATKIFDLKLFAIFNLKTRFKLLTNDTAIR